MDKVLTALGRTFIGAGTIVFLFVAYQLWGTNFAEARSQDQLDKQTEAFLSQTATPGGADQTTTSTTTKPGQSAPPATANTTPAPPPAPSGSAVAVLKIPKINLQKSIIEGTSVDDLKKAPGHYTGTPLPGQPGNASIAGHRTTYGAPFGNLDKLKNGDLIEATTKQGSFNYKVIGQQVVDPSNVSVLNQGDKNILTLTTCHPKFSAAKRLIITAELDTSPAPASAPTTNETPTTTAAPTQSTIPGDTTATSEPSESTISADNVSDLDHSLSGEAVSKIPAILWGIAALLVGVAAWAGGRLWRRVPAYIIGTPVFLVVLFIFFENFSALLPANA